jgi:hypothetical protein
VRPPSDGLPLEPVADPVAVERVTSARALHAEGIPMVLALEDVSGPGGTPTATTATTASTAPSEPDAVRAVGGALARRVEEYRPLLRPQATEDDDWAVHDVLVVVAFAHGPVRP